MNPEEKKLKIVFISPISSECNYLHKNKIEIVKNPNDADYIIFEANSDPIHIIQNIKYSFPKNKLVFIMGMN